MVKTGEIPEKKFKQWLEETGDTDKLPERLKKKKKGSAKKTRKKR